MKSRRKWTDETEKTLSLVKSEGTGHGILAHGCRSCSRTVGSRDDCEGKMSEDGDGERDDHRN